MPAAVGDSVRYITAWLRSNSRTRLGIVLETGEATLRCITLPCSSATVCRPMRSIRIWRLKRFMDQIHEGKREVKPGKEEEKYKADELAVKHYIKAIGKGLLKVMSKMGISTLQSYKGGQIFEAVGLNSDVINRCFAGTASRLEGVGFDVLAVEALRRHQIGFPVRKETRALPVLPNPGQYAWRKDGESHLFSPENNLLYLQEAAHPTVA